MGTIRLLSANDNLVERLRLLVLNDSEDAGATQDGGGEDVYAHCFEQWHQLCDWSGVDKWVLLVGKEFDKQALTILGNIHRVICSQVQSNRDAGRVDSPPLSHP